MYTYILLDTLTNTAHHTSLHAMWVALQNWFTEYSYISTSAVYLSHDGKAFSWFWPRPWKRLLDFSVEAKPILCFWSTLSSLLVLYSLPKSCGFLWSLIYLPTTPLLYPHLFPTYTHNYICIFDYIEPWFGLSPGKTFSFSELVSPHLLQGWGESSNCIYCVTKCQVLIHVLYLFVPCYSYSNNPRW